MSGQKPSCVNSVYIHTLRQEKKRNHPHRLRGPAVISIALIPENGKRAMGCSLPGRWEQLVPTPTSHKREKGTERYLRFFSSWTILDLFCHAYAAFSVGWNSGVQPEVALRVVSPDTMGTDRFFGDSRQNDDSSRDQEQEVLLFLAQSLSTLQKYCLGNSYVKLHHTN